MADEPVTTDTQMERIRKEFYAEFANRLAGDTWMDSFKKDVWQFFETHLTQVEREARKDTITNIRVWSHLMVVNNDRFTIDALRAKLEALEKEYSQEALQK